MAKAKLLLATLLAAAALTACGEPGPAALVAETHQNKPLIGKTEPVAPGLRANMEPAGGQSLSGRAERVEP